MAGAARSGALDAGLEGVRVLDEGGRASLLSGVTRLRGEIRRRIVGQEPVVDEIIMSLLAGGHALLVGVPGLAKTLMIRSVSDALDLHFRRIQFTPDLVPSDITGSEILEEDTATGARRFRFVRGPVFANVLLARASLGARCERRAVAREGGRLTGAARAARTRGSCVTRA